MKRLYESLLDDDEELFKNTNEKTVFKERKESIINFIKEHYYLLNKNGRRLKIERYLKINKDFTVDIKQTDYSKLYVISKGSDANLPLAGFNWGTVDKLELCIDGNSTKITGLPKECNSLYIKGDYTSTTTDSHILDNLNIKVNEYMEVWNLGVKHINDLGIGDNIGGLFFYNLERLESIKTLPRNIKDLSFFRCYKLNSISQTNVCKIYCFKTSITDEEVENKVKYVTKHINNE